MYLRNYIWVRIMENRRIQLKRDSDKKYKVGQKRSLTKEEMAHTEAGFSRPVGMAPDKGSRGSGFDFRWVDHKISVYF